MRKIYLMLVCTLTLVLTSCPGGNTFEGQVSGYVVNRKAGTPVQGSTVSVEGGGTATTNSEGFYTVGAPLGRITLTFSKSGYAQSRVEGLEVVENQTTYYDTIQSEVFEPGLPAQAPSITLSIEDGDVLTGRNIDDDRLFNSFEVILSAESVEPNRNGLFFADVAIGQSGGQSGFLNGSIPHVGIFDYTGEAEKVTLYAYGFEGKTTIHAVVYDQNYNRSELIRHVTIESLIAGGIPQKPLELLALATTFGDTSVFGTLSTSSTIDLTTSNLTKVFYPNVRASKPSLSLAPQGFLDEVLTWVDVYFTYNSAPSDWPTAFEIFRKLEGEDDYRLIGRTDPFLLNFPNSQGIPTNIFGFVDATAALRPNVEVTYRIDAVTENTRQSSAVSNSVTPLAPFYVVADSPQDGATDVDLSPNYQMSFSGASEDVVAGVVVLDRVQSESFLEWFIENLTTADDAALRAVGGSISLTGATIPHNFRNSSPTELQPFHTYDWQPIAITCNDVCANATALSIAADYFDTFGVGFGVQDGPVNTFTTGN